MAFKSLFAGVCGVIPDTSAACSAHFASQHRRKQHAIIGKPRLFTDHRDGITAERTLGELFAQAGSRHAVANDDERFAHRDTKPCSSVHNSAAPTLAKTIMVLRNIEALLLAATASIRLTKHSRSFAWIAKIRSMLRRAAGEL